jgi:hypothetical protein
MQNRGLGCGCPPRPCPNTNACAMIRRRVRCRRPLSRTEPVIVNRDGAQPLSRVRAGHACGRDLGPIGVGLVRCEPVFDVIDVNFCPHQALLQDPEEARGLGGVGTFHAKLLDRLLSLRNPSFGVGLMALRHNELSGPICHLGFPVLTLLMRLIRVQDHWGNCGAETVDQLIELGIMMVPVAHNNCRDGND